MNPPDGYIFWGGFNEIGHTFRAWQPGNGEVKQVIIVQAYKDDDLVRTVEVPLSHSTVFGLDVEDIGEVERATAQLVQELDTFSEFG